MRIIGEIPDPRVKITLFHWNNRYLIKLEWGLFEQTFKIQEFDLSAEEDLKKIVSDSFITSALNRFTEMASELTAALEKMD
ncbi:MAG TPA: hypothetical protein DGG95_03930 [Cytophagales bacterium]|jgi:hypothetical protein|nr:hypothetical protein [Cytophagales bacterium]